MLILSIPRGIRWNTIPNIILSVERSQGKIDEMSASVLAIQHNNHLFARIKQKEVMFKLFRIHFGTKSTVVYKEIQNSEGSDGEDTEEDSYLNADLGLKSWSA